MSGWGAGIPPAWVTGPPQWAYQSHEGGGMVLVDQDRLQTIPDPTGLAFRIVADGHHSGEVVGCACGGAAVSA